ncbi:MAG: hypothetical protein O7D91_09310 [Planctomycetota bacterium]|nr:hypothetical protein [Planctomycetota bacterium]
MKILPDRSLLLNDDLGGSGPCVSPSTAPSAQVDYTTRSNKVDAEFDRFARVAVPMADGSGWFDPAFGPDLPSGVSGEQWRAFENDCARMGKSRIVTNSRDLKQLEDQQCLIRS